MILWESSFTYIWQRPIFGYGLDSFPFYSPAFFPLERTMGFNAHNVYIQVIFEMGFVGLIGFVLIFCRSFGWLARFWRFDRRGVSVAAAVMVVYLIGCYSDNVLEYLTFDWCFWLFFGLVFAQLSQYAARSAVHRKADQLQSRMREKRNVWAARSRVAG
jgi:O-antigen ligase